MISTNDKQQLKCACVCNRLASTARAFELCEVFVRIVCGLHKNATFSTYTSTTNRQHQSYAIQQCWMRFIVLFSSIRVVYCYERWLTRGFICRIVYTKTANTHRDACRSNRSNLMRLLQRRWPSNVSWAHFISFQWFRSHKIRYC